MALPFSIVILLTLVVMVVQYAIILLCTWLTVAGVKLVMGPAVLDELGSVRIAGAVWVLSACGFIVFGMVAKAIEDVARMIQAYRERTAA